MIDAGDEGGVDTESVALAFGDDVRGWFTVQEALEAFLEGQVVTRRCPQFRQDTNG